MRIRWLWLAAMLAAAGPLLSGCGGGTSEDDPNRTLLTPAEARDIATQMTNVAFRDQKITDGSGKIVQISPDSWQVAEQRGDEWVFELHPPTGPQAEFRISIDATKHTKPKVGYVPNR